PMALRWTPEGQRRRYEAFLEVLPDLQGKSLIDLGCGRGDFLGFLKSKGIEVRYTGVDLNENFIKEAREAHPEGTFYVLDIEEVEIDETFDIALAIGVFNLKVADIRNSMINTLKRLFSLCKEVMCFDLIIKEPTTDPELNAFLPEEAVELVRKNLSRRFSLRTDLIDGIMFFSVYHL
ncbi:MAG: class I SAM-dependent methyltransferase, partial [Nitrospirae bacterium]